MSSTRGSSPPGVSTGGLRAQGTQGIEATLVQLFNVAQPSAAQMARSLGEVAGSVHNRSASLRGGRWQPQGPEAAITQLLSAGCMIGQSCRQALQTSMSQLGREAD